MCTAQVRVGVRVRVRVRVRIRSGWFLNLLAQAVSEATSTANPKYYKLAINYSKLQTQHPES